MQLCNGPLEPDHGGLVPASSLRIPVVTSVVFPQQNSVQIWTPVPSRRDGTETMTHGKLSHANVVRQLVEIVREQLREDAPSD
jgi:hypothetical protein